MSVSKFKLAKFDRNNNKGRERFLHFSHHSKNPEQIRQLEGSKSLQHGHRFLIQSVTTTNPPIGLDSRSFLKRLFSYPIIPYCLPMGSGLRKRLIQIK